MRHLGARLPLGPSPLDVCVERLTAQGYLTSSFLPALLGILSNANRAAQVRDAWGRAPSPRAFRIEPGRIILVYLTRRIEDGLLPATVTRCRMLWKALGAAWDVRLLHGATHGPGMAEIDVSRGHAHQWALAVARSDGEAIAIKPSGRLRGRPIIGHGGPERN